MLCLLLLRLVQPPPLLLLLLEVERCQLQVWLYLLLVQVSALVLHLLRLRPMREGMLHWLPHKMRACRFLTNLVAAVVCDPWRLRTRRIVAILVLLCGPLGLIVVRIDKMLGLVQ